MGQVPQASSASRLATCVERKPWRSLSGRSACQTGLGLSPARLRLSRPLNQALGACSHLALELVDGRDTQARQPCRFAGAKALRS
jgi:hypothetical protein